MERSGRGLLALALLVLGSSSGTAAEREPIYEGKPLHVWIKGMRDAGISAR